MNLLVVKLDNGWLFGIFAFLTPAVAFGQAAYTIKFDEFGTTQHVDTGVVNPASDLLNDSGLFESAGANRELTLATFLSGTPTGSPGQALDVNLFGSGRYSLATSASIESDSTVHYSSIGGGGGFDLTSGGTDLFIFDVVSADQTSDWTITVTDFHGDSATRTFTQGAMASPTQLTVDFVSFTENGPGTTDFNLVTDFELTLQGTALDYELERLGVGFIPEPSSVLLVLLGSAIWFLRRDRRPQV